MENQDFEKRMFITTQRNCFMRIRAKEVFDFDLGFLLLEMKEEG
jgi:hypothetical protein